MEQVVQYSQNKTWQMLLKLQQHFYYRSQNWNWTLLQDFNRNGCVHSTSYKNNGTFLFNCFSRLVDKFIKRINVVCHRFLLFYSILYIRGSDFQITFTLSLFIKCLISDVSKHICYCNDKIQKVHSQNIVILIISNFKCNTCNIFCNNQNNKR